MPLQALNIADSKTAGQIWVFPKRLMSSAPSWISENIDIRCPESQAFIDIRILSLLLHVKLCPCLRRHCITDLL